MPRIWMLALEKPHCGVSGVPFMNRTTGDEATARSIAERTSSDRSLAWKGVRKRAEGRGRAVLARVAARKACGLLECATSRVLRHREDYRGNCACGKHCSDVRGGITSDGGESTSAIRRKYLDEVRMCQDGAMDADITNLLFAAALSLYNTITITILISVLFVYLYNPARCFNSMILRDF
jgi:hypothetical protein